MVILSYESNFLFSFKIIFEVKKFFLDTSEKILITLFKKKKL